MSCLDSTTLRNTAFKPLLAASQTVSSVRSRSSNMRSSKIAGRGAFWIILRLNQIILVLDKIARVDEAHINIRDTRGYGVDYKYSIAANRNDWLSRSKCWVGLCRHRIAASSGHFLLV